MNHPHEEPIVIVSGLPRSGTSMMMQMLEVGGLPVLTDHERTADEDNPEGYYEWERAKQLPKGDVAWLDRARGKVVKVISALLEHLPTGYTYKVVFMHRSLDEVLASQRKMLKRRGQPADASDDARMASLFTKHLQKIEGWLDEQPHFDVLYVNYNALLADPPAHVAQIVAFFDGTLDEAAMLNVVNPDLYRNRRRSTSR